MLTEEQLRFLTELAERYGDMLTEYAWRFWAYRQHMLPAAQDAVQEVFVKAVQHADSLMSHPNQAAWLKASLKHHLISLYRRSKRHPEQLWGDVEMKGEVEAQQAAEAIERWAQREQLDEVLRVADAILTPAEHDTFRDTFLSGLSTQEAARLEAVSPDTVRGRVFRIRRKLRKYFHLSMLIGITMALLQLGR